MNNSLDSIICKYLSTSSLSDELELSSSLDSLLLVEMITEIEEDLGIDFEIEDLSPENLKTVKSLREIVAKKVSVI